MPTRGRGMAKGFRLGDHNSLCDRCQKKFWASDLIEEWTGWMVCSSCWEPRHPQEFLKGHPDNQNVKWTRPDQSADSTEYNGDVGKTLVKDVNNDIQDWNEELTEDRVVILSSTNAQRGDQFIIYKTEDSDTKLIITSTVRLSGTTV